MLRIGSVMAWSFSGFKTVSGCVSVCVHLCIFVIKNVVYVVCQLL